MKYKFCCLVFVFLSAMLLSFTTAKARGFRNLLSPSLMCVVPRSSLWTTSFRARSRPSFISTTATHPFFLSSAPHNKVLFRTHNRALSLKGSKQQKNKKDNNSQLLAEFFNLVHMKDFMKAKEAFEQISSASHLTSPRQKNLLTAMLSLCEKGDQLDFALKIRSDLEAAGFVFSESDIFPLIKCASDMGAIPLAKLYLQEIIDAKFIVRHRDIFPILKAMAASPSVNSSHEALEECFHLKDYGLYPRPQELELILASGVRTNAIKDPLFRKKLSALISLINDTYCAIDQVSALRMHQAINVGTLAGVEAESVEYLTQMYKMGILVDKPSDITGQVRSSTCIFVCCFLICHIMGMLYVLLYNSCFRKTHFFLLVNFSLNGPLFLGTLRKS